MTLWDPTRQDSLGTHFKAGYATGSTRSAGLTSKLQRNHPEWRDFQVQVHPETDGKIAAPCQYVIKNTRPGQPPLPLGAVNQAGLYSPAILSQSGK